MADLQHTLTALFDTRADASRAVAALVEAGVSRAEIEILPGEGAPTYTRPASQASYDRHRDVGGFWAALKDLFLPHEGRYAYAEGMSRGGVVVAVRVDEVDLDRAAEILEQHGSVDVDQREAAWRREGWTGYQATGDEGSLAPASGPAAALPSAPTAGSEQVVPVVEEQLRVGKRRVLKGRVRVRAYVVEVPVTAEVELRRTHVRVERHPVEQPLTPEEEERLLRERTLEAHEVVEVPVVEKIPVVKEEIVLLQETEEHVERIADRVRRTEVEIEDERGTGTSTGPTREQ